ncbi:MAG TPA: hypothetical protein VF546_11920 [Pyrinomonadaceae bacterium]|jgi:hypothetical protein
MRTRGWPVWIFLCSLGVLVLALACGRKTAVRRGSAGGPVVTLPDDKPRTLAPLPARTPTPKLARLRDRAMQATAAARGLDWQTAPGVIELTGWEYGTRSKEMADALGGEELRALSRLAVAGGMLPEGTDLATLAASFAAASAGATYSPLDKQVLLLADPRGKTPANDSLLAHEFTHALQDQHFDLLKLLLARPYDFDREEALFAVVEGDAVDVQRRLEQGDAWTRRPLEDLARFEDQRFDFYRKEIGALFPPLLTETFIFRYRDGVRFVEAVRRKGGARAVDELFRRPPATSAQVLHPEKYFADERPPAVSVNEQSFAAEGWTTNAATPLGEIGVRGLLLKAHAPKDAARAAAGWAGDRAYLFERAAAPAPLFVWQTNWDNTTDAEEFCRAYNALLRQTATPAQTNAANVSAWREGQLLVVVRLDAAAVLVVRGAESDVRAALALVPPQ